MIEAIRNRRSIRKMRSDITPTKEQVAALIDAATWAPNHHLTEPWRFIVIEGDERGRLGDALSSALVGSFPDTPKEKLEMERTKPFMAPVILVVLAAPKEGPKIVEREELIAAGAALQNLLLAAHALGLSTMVRTGAHAYSETMSSFFKLERGESLVAMVYLGFGSESQPIGKRTAARIEWRGK